MKPTLESVIDAFEKEFLPSKIIPDNKSNIPQEHADLFLEVYKSSYKSFLTHHLKELAEYLSLEKKGNEWFKGSYGQARLKRISYLNGYNQAVEDLNQKKKEYFNE